MFVRLLYLNSVIHHTYATPTGSYRATRRPRTTLPCSTRASEAARESTERRPAKAGVLSNQSSSNVCTVYTQEIICSKVVTSAWRNGGGLNRALVFVLIHSLNRLRTTSGTDCPPAPACCCCNLTTVVHRIVVCRSESIPTLLYDAVDQSNRPHLSLCRAA